MLDLVYENHTSDKSWDKKFFKDVFNIALKHLKLDDKKVELGLQLIGPERMRELNDQYRHKDKPTDVLSFPLNEKGLIEKYDIMPLGDIFICPEIAKKQAEELDISSSQETARLAVHGLLHLLDYDHERSPEDEKKMIDLQEEILDKLPNL